MKTNIRDFRKIAKLIRSSDTYDVLDYSGLEHLNLSLTVLHPGRETTGHRHSGDEEEVYVFVSGKGIMRLDDEKFEVEEGDVVTIKKKIFHKVYNDGKSDLVFWAVFEKYEGRE